MTTHSAYPSTCDPGLPWLKEMPAHWGLDRAKFIFRKMDREVRPDDDVVTAFRDGMVTLPNKPAYGRIYILNKRDRVSRGCAKATWSFIRWMVLPEQLAFPIRMVNAPLFIRYADQSIPLLAHTIMPICYGIWHVTILFSHWQKVSVKRSSDFRFDVFKELVLPIPPIEEQKAIVNYLDRQTAKIDALIAKKRHLLDLLAEQRAVIINHAVTKGINRTMKMKDSGVAWLGQVPENWEVKKIKFLCHVQRGQSPRPIDDPNYFDDNGEYSWVRISDVSASNKYLLKTEQRLSLLGKSKGVLIEPNELVVSIAASVGKPIITGIKCCIHDGLVWLKGLRQNKEYYFYILSGGELYKGLGKTGTQLNLNSEFIGDIFVPIPPKIEQDGIVTFITQKIIEIDNLATKIETAIDRLQEYRSALISSR